MMVKPYDAWNESSYESRGVWTSVCIVLSVCRNGSTARTFPVFAKLKDKTEAPVSQDAIRREGE